MEVVHRSVRAPILSKTGASLARSWACKEITRSHCVTCCWHHSPRPLPPRLYTHMLARCRYPCPHPHPRAQPSPTPPAHSHVGQYAHEEVRNDAAGGSCSDEALPQVRQARLAGGVAQGGRALLQQGGWFGVGWGGLGWGGVAAVVVPGGYTSMAQPQPQGMQCTIQERGRLMAGIGSRCRGTAAGTPVPTPSHPLLCCTHRAGLIRPHARAAAVSEDGSIDCQDVGHGKELQVKRWPGYARAGWA